VTVDDDDPDRQDATPTPASIEIKAGVPSPSISMRQHGWAVWAQIAIDHEKDARLARETDPTTEHLSGLVAIAAAAFALDALYGVATSEIPVPEVDNPPRPRPLDRLVRWLKRKRRRRWSHARRVSDRLRRGVSPGKLAESWWERIRKLYATRDAVVHFREQDAAPVWHPGLESHTSPESFAWRLEAAEIAVDLMLEVLTCWADHPSERVREWADRFGPSVVSLLERRRGDQPFA
jgi:hypothetical protein